MGGAVVLNKKEWVSIAIILQTAFGKLLDRCVVSGSTRQECRKLLDVVSVKGGERGGRRAAGLSKPEGGIGSREAHGSDLKAASCVCSTPARSSVQFWSVKASATNRGQYGVRTGLVVSER